MNDIAIGAVVAQQLARETGLQVAFSSMTHAGDDAMGFDGYLTIGTTSGVIDLPVEIKRNLRRARIRFLRDRLAHEASWILLADYLSQPLQQELRANQINYVDAAGNAFVNHQRLFILVEGRKNHLDKSPEGVFRPAEIGALLCLLFQPELLKEPYRRLEQQLATSKATLSGLFRKLREKGYLVGEPGSLRFQRCEALLDELATSFQDVFKPKLLVQRFRFARADGISTWPSWQLPTGTCWGGESAIHLQNGVLMPEEWTLYTSDALHHLLRYLPIVPDSEGPISVYRCFWPTSMMPGTFSPSAPDVLVYMDLIGSGVGRNRQAAKQMHLKVC
ncbi:MAG: hypothetical protein OHK0039_14760 [Bacteroidia bacterium]